MIFITTGTLIPAHKGADSKMATPINSADGGKFRPRPIFEITDANGKVFPIKEFVPSKVGILIVEMQDSLKGVDGKVSVGGLKKETIDAMFQILEAILILQYDFMTREWIENNISFQDMISIFERVMALHRKDLSDNFSGKEEPAKPEKKPRGVRRS
jgi:hypothetical protein